MTEQSRMPKTILNVASGKLMPFDSENDIVVNIDPIYSTPPLYPESLEKILNSKIGNQKYFFKYHWDNFYIENPTLLFDKICIYRFLEHVEFTAVPYFIYVMSQLLKPNGIIDVIVPDYEKLSGMILNESPGTAGWELHNIILTTEMLNTPEDPHASIWTEDRLIYYFDLEKYFRDIEVRSDFSLDGRDIYLRMIAKRNELIS